MSQAIKQGPITVGGGKKQNAIQSQNLFKIIMKVAVFPFIEAQ
jgi:deoxyhypusine synthase